MSGTLVKVNPKNTTQSAFLENFLARRRTNKVRPYTIGKRILDFGCGEHLWTLKALADTAQSSSGFDILYQGLPIQKTEEGFTIYGSLEQINEPIDCIVSLACFEHIEPEILPRILRSLSQISAPNATIVGTVPRPPSKPILEFLSYRLGLIDKSQILDHKKYYDRHSLAATASQGGWTLEKYETFQLGMNSFFILRKTRP